MSERTFQPPATESIHIDNCHLILVASLSDVFFPSIHECILSQYIRYHSGRKNIFERTLFFGIYALLKLSK